MLKVALYFGSFNPVHNGHIWLAKYLIEKQLSDEVWFVVSPCNPLKKPSGLLDEHLRLEMLELAINDVKQFKTCDIEFTMPIPSYTIDTLRTLSEKHPGIGFSLMIGSDNALIFDRWKNYEDILSAYPVWVYPRRGYEASKVLSKYPGMKMLQTPYYDISSTQIREKLSCGEDTGQWLHPSVEKFIKLNHLYLE